MASRLRPGDRVWLPRAKQGGRELLEELEKVPGAVVRELPLYDTVYQPAGALDLSAEFQKHPETLAVFTSASTVRGFAAMAEGLDLTSVPGRLHWPPDRGGSPGPGDGGSYGRACHHRQPHPIGEANAQRSVKHGFDSETPPPAGQ